MAKDFTVTIRDDSPRAQDFMKAFGRLTVNIKSFIPEMMSHPDFDEPQKMYKLDFDLVTEEEFERLVDVVAEKFKADRDRVHLELKQAGIPILASDCTVTIENPQRWFDVEVEEDEDEEEYEDLSDFEDEWDDDNYADYDDGGYDFEDDYEDEFEDEWDEEDEEDYVYQDPLVSPEEIEKAAQAAADAIIEDTIHDDDDYDEDYWGEE